jgi:hypothetical protein
MTRYALTQRPDGGRIEPFEYGDYIKYSDHRDEIQRILQGIVDIDELSDTMPPDMYAALASNYDIMQEALRAIVRMTKQEALLIIDPEFPVRPLFDMLPIEDHSNGTPENRT